MATVKKLEKNKWEVRYDSYDQQGKRHQRRKQFTRAADAKAFVASLDASTPYEASYLCFDTWVDQWFEAYSQRLEIITITAYRHVLDIWKAYFGKKKLSAITHSDIERFCTIVARPDNPITKSPLAPVSIRHYLTILSRALKYAVRDGYITSNPVKLIEMPKIVRNDISLPDIQELQKRVDALKGTYLHLPVCIALLTGMRRSEIMGLQWDCVDLENRTITIRRVRIRLAKKALQAPIGPHSHMVDLPGGTNNIIRDYTKNKHNRTVSISQGLANMLKRHKLLQASNRLRQGNLYVVSDYVCTHDDGSLVRDNELTASLKGLCRFHDLRHLSASILLDAGYSVATVADRIGHTTPATTLRIYAHSLKTKDQHAAEELDRRLDIKT